MPIDAEVEQAIRRSALDANQPEELASRLIAWIRSLSDGSASLEDREDVARHLEDSVLPSVHLEEEE